MRTPPSRSRLVHRLAVCFTFCLLVGWQARGGDTNSDWWALRSLTRPAAPSASTHPVDAFIQARLATEGRHAAPEADRATLARRLYFDLIGLPPTPQELKAFVSDPSPDPYPQLVDRLLASPRYGERWARHWMDTVHFAETHGNDQDQIGRAHV